MSTSKKTMRAVLIERYGHPQQNLTIGEVEKPELTDDGVLVRVRAASLNRGYWYAVTGTPWVGRPMMGIRKPKSPLTGGDFAGVVEAVGKNVTDLEAGDEVFGLRSGALADYVNVEKGVARKPASLSFEEAAAIPTAALTALQGLRDHGKLQPGQHVLINGAGGGVGNFAVQIAKSLGATVTAVCSAENAELVRSLGADRVVDYRKDDFTRSGEHYDLLFDNAGSRSWRAMRRVLKKDAIVVLVGGPMGRLTGPLGHIMRTKLAAKTCSQSVIFFVAKPNKDDLVAMRELVDAGKVTVPIDRRYELSQIAEAMAYMGKGHTRGKVVIAV